MMAASLTPFIPGSKLAGRFGKLQDKIDELKFNRNREVNNLPVDGIHAQRAIDKIDNKLRGITGQQRKLVEDAPSDQLAPSRQPEQEDMLTRLQNLEMYRDRPSRKLKNR
jgi:hypothetical protein